MGIADSTDDEKITDCLENYQQNAIQYSNGRYTAQLPWKQDHPPLPTNYQITKRRTENTIRRLSAEPEILQKYGEIIAEQERRGFIEKVDEDSQTTRVHYIPHHPVKKDSSTTPIRIVYDCSCRKSRDEPSLNDCLESTPPILNDLTSLLTRFRYNRYAVTTDIEKAFLHVGLHESDRDVTRFLWLQNTNDPCSPLITYRFKVVLFGATCLPFMLNATLLKNLRLNPSLKAATIIERDLYVDNVVSSFTNELDLLNYFWESRTLMYNAGMNLRSWTSNSDNLRHTASTVGVLDSDEFTKVLGLRWNPTSDMLSFPPRVIPQLDKVTKRAVLKYTSRIYDPLGLLSPVTIRTKILLQDLWKKSYD
ncbi:uncharacterized protein LOC123538185 [Mercenaria mercenaria]|uniref:uncharacterized protein LOC123538185 n=1 Tax=Mercenaria mercenaria TaxID=6596 RepID=UPI00234E9CE1|nr:uncharacterized protein LOC123538185 [Mercenaria mercenaria]